MDFDVSSATHLSPLDWLMPRTYVSHILCFPSTHEGVFRVLRSGLSGMSKDIPYLLAGVVDSEQPKGSVRLTVPYQTVDDLISCQDLSHALDYGVLKESGFAPSWLIMPEIRHPDTIPPFPSPEPVFRSRLVLVKGGVLISVAVHHRTTDITGFGALLKVWAAHCRTGSSVDIGFDRSWYDRGVLFNASATAPNEAQSAVPSLTHIRDPMSLPQPSLVAPKSLEFETCIFLFSQKALHDLKQTANAYVSSLADSVSWVSTNDTLTALLWGAVVWAEQDAALSEPGSDGNQTCTVGIPVNFRSRFDPPLSKDYLGVAIGMTSASIPRRDLVSISEGTDATRDSQVLDSEVSTTLARIAATIRASIGRIDEEGMRSVLAHTASQLDISNIKLGPQHDGISIVSWADEGTYELDWGTILGRCEAVRLAKLTGRRYPIILPRLPGGGLEVLVSLDRQSMQRFSQSRLITMFGSLKCSA